uniref:Alpha-carbonic anhydrase domain-containing protein n=1 Tax=Steinernema glaseri TaxID=37863 RepID=A0A1I8AU34_9BILA
MAPATRQSPIDICSQNVCHAPDFCKPQTLEIDYKPGDCAELVTHHHGWTVKVKDNCQTIVKAEHLPSEYRLAQFHAHWSRDGSRGSEHLLDGKALSGEMHFVFWNTRYGTFDEALRHGDGLAVLGVFLQEGAANAAYQPLVNCVQQALATKGSVTVPADLDVLALLPKAEQRHFCTYLGSLTTPPFAECVVWTVVKTPVEVSKEQLDVFRQIVPDNVRDCQELHGREVKASFN